MKEIWAKSIKGEKIVTLAQHIKDLLDVFDELKEKIAIDKDLLSAIKQAIICHDFGKAFPAFQIRTVGNKNYEPFYIYKNLPHSILSVFLINKERLSKKFCELIISAVSYHHWRETFIELISNGQEIGKLCTELESKGYMSQIEENLKCELKKLDEEYEYLVRYQRDLAQGLINDVPFYRYALPPYQLYWLPQRIEMDEESKKSWIFISGFLQRCDHFASFCEEEGEKDKSEIENLSLENIEKIILNKLKKDKIWQIEEVKDKFQKNVILIAPTGYGKTEFAFLWSNGEKIFYTLPLRSAVNQIFKRAEDIFNDTKERVGILHSDADVFLVGDGGENQASIRCYDLSKQLAYPVIISTGDQFFPYALRPPGYEKIYATFSYSRLVIDEVQAYEPVAAAIIVKFIEDITRLGGRFLLMTATLPKFIEERVEDRIGKGNFELINIYENEKDKFKSTKKHKIKLILIQNNIIEQNKFDFSIPDNEIDKILQEANKGKRVLVVVNTIKQAQDIYKKLKIKAEDYPDLENKLWLFHARFTIKDREAKEEILEREFKNPKLENEKEGKILLATQVVEASLDIDADVLFTEIAPLDSLIQRMGRVLRRYGPLSKPEDIPALEEPNVYIWVFKNGLQSGRGYVYDKDVVLLSLKFLEDFPKFQDKEFYTEWITKKSKNKDKIDDSEWTSFGKEKEISEYDKYDLVSKLYSYLPRECEYFVKFQKTLDILDAGFMSDRKEEAQEIFRRIYAIPVVPVGRDRDRNEKFIEDVKSFFEKFSSEKRLYTLFKKEVLAKYVLSIPIQFGKDLRYITSNKVEDWFIGEEFESYVDINRVKRWCRDLYWIKIDYSPEIGGILDIQDFPVII